MKAKIRNQKWEISHERAKKTYGERRGPKTKIEKTWPRKKRTLYARLRTNHAKELKHYQHRIGNEEDAICAKCGEEDETIEHVLCKCPALELQRRRIYEGEWHQEMMVTAPKQSMELLKHRFEGLKDDQDPTQE